MTSDAAVADELIHLGTLSTLLDLCVQCSDNNALHGHVLAIVMHIIDHPPTADTANPLFRHIFIGMCLCVCVCVCVCVCAMSPPCSVLIPLSLSPIPSAPPAACLSISFSACRTTILPYINHYLHPRLHS